jgi:hypothetical protein
MSKRPPSAWARTPSRVTDSSRSSIAWPRTRNAGVLVRKSSAGESTVISGGRRRGASSNDGTPETTGACEACLRGPQTVEMRLPRDLEVNPSWA